MAKLLKETIEELNETLVEIQHAITEVPELIIFKLEVDDLILRKFDEIIVTLDKINRKL